MFREIVSDNDITLYGDLPDDRGRDDSFFNEDRKATQKELKAGAKNINNVRFNQYRNQKNTKGYGNQHFGNKKGNR